MAGRSSSVLVFVLGMTVLFGLLYLSESTRPVSPNEPRVVHTANNPSLAASCLGVEHYESIFVKGPVFELPSYIPHGYALQCINVHGNIPEEAVVSLFYYWDDKEFYSRFLPEIEKDSEYPPEYEKWTSEYYDAGGILITRNMEFFAEDDPQNNDKLKHAEVEHALAIEREGVNWTMKFANGNPVMITDFGVDRSGKPVNWLFLYMDHNWLVRIIGTSDADELFKMAETIHEIDNT